MILARTGFKLRGRQPEWIEAIEKDLKTYSRVLCVAPGGVGKSSAMSALAYRAHESDGTKTLVLENRDRLTEQTAARLEKETGLSVDIEKGKQRASPHADIVVGCVQTAAKISSLTGFVPGHFRQLIPDECHFAFSPSWQRIINYHHRGSETLVDGWVLDPKGIYTPRCNVIGFTATPQIGGGRNMGELFTHRSVNYSYLDAISEGWLVGIKEINIPVRIDVRRFRARQTAEGRDFSAEDNSAALTPEVIEKLAAQVVEHASDKKTMAFLPSVDTGRMLAEALNRRGLNAIFVSGECLDRSEKTDEFEASGSGTVLVNCALYVYGIDFPDVDCIAWFKASISKVNYFQGLYRGTRILPGLVDDEMGAERRLAAIAGSKKPYMLLLSPFYVSDRLHILEVYDLFTDHPPANKRAGAIRDFTEPAKIRDALAAMEKEADKHAHKQPRTVNPLALAVTLGVNNYTPQTAQDAAPASKEEKDTLLALGVDTTQAKSSGEAQALISKLRTRAELRLATPASLRQLTLMLHWPAEKAVLMSAKQASVLIWKRIHYKKPDETPTGCTCNATESPPCSFCESGAASVRDGT